MKYSLRAGRYTVGAMRCAVGAIVVFAGLIASMSCVDRGPGPAGKKIDPAYVAKHLLADVPAVELMRLDVPLDGGKVVYVGNTIDKPKVAPGETVRVTHYWRVTRSVGAGWRVFALLRGPRHTADFMNLPATDMQIGHAPALWKAGQLIEDVQDITLRPDWASATATLTVGLIAQGQHGFVDRMAASGPFTDDRAVVARTIDIDLSRAPPPAGTIYIPHARESIVVDGMATEGAWADAVTSPELAAAEGSAEPVGKATAKLIWDEQYLYAFVTIADTDVWTTYSKHDDPLWKQDCIELFIDADGNRRGYVELQVNPSNATFDSWFATTRAQPGDPSWESGIQTAVQLRGTPEPGDTDRGWDVELAIPWSAVRGRDDAMAVTLPPNVGDRWRLNLVRVDVKTGDKNVSASSWNRITSADFHALDRMLTAVFADITGSIVGGTMPAPPPRALPPSAPAQPPAPPSAAPSQQPPSQPVQPPPIPSPAGSGAGSAASGAGSAVSGAGSAR
jgi:Carbohydrate family 9 binding domain-like